MNERYRDCVFFNRIGINPDPHPCGGIMTRHEVLYQSENGKRKEGNTVFLCDGHQQFVHHKNQWGDEDFDKLISKVKRH